MGFVMVKLSMFFLFFCVSLSSLHSKDCFYASSLSYRHIYEDFSDIFSNIPHKLFIRNKIDDVELESIPDIKIWHPLVDEQEIIFNAAKSARERANEHLMIAEGLLSELTSIKDWRFRERLQTLVGACITTTVIPEPRVKFLTVALALLTDLVVNEGFEKSEIAYKLYIELSYATTCLEEFNYYSRLAVAGKDEDRDPQIDGWEYTNFAIGYLTYADMLTASLEYKLHGAVVSSYITELRNDLMNDMIDYRRLTYKHSLRLGCVLENFDEIIAECSNKDRVLAQKIYKYLKDSLYFIKKAEQEWDIYGESDSYED